MKDALGHGSAAHQEGVEQVGKPVTPSKYAQRQMWNVQNLQIPPRDDVTMTKFQADQVGDSVLVHRAYYPNHAPSLSYSEGFKVGPRGSVKQIYATKPW